MTFLSRLAAVLFALTAAAAGPAPQPIALPGGQGGIGFDDLTFAPDLKKLLVPAGRSGNLDLIDPATRQIVPIAGFSAQGQFAKGHGEGTTSADAGRGLIFATDRTALKLVVLDPTTKTAVAKADLASGPDYVRWVAPTGEIWVTQPDKDRIEIFSLPASGPPVPVHKEFLAVPGGPESLIVDAAHGRAYTHLWKSTTLAIDLKSRAIVARWPNGCVGSRGIALDAGRGFLFAGCAEGKAAVLDVNKNGAVLSTLKAGSGVDIIAYSSRLGHLYLPGGTSGTMAVLGVSKAGKLSLLSTVKTARGAHCAAADDLHQVWVCDPDHGRLLLVNDTYPASQ
jgi:DNA-binding beta-propeller fold protein YncE